MALTHVLRVHLEDDDLPSVLIGWRKCGESHNVRAVTRAEQPVVGRGRVHDRFPPRAGEIGRSGVLKYGRGEEVGAAERAELDLPAPGCVYGEGGADGGVSA